VYSTSYVAKQMIRAKAYDLTLELWICDFLTGVIRLSVVKSQCHCRFTKDQKTFSRMWLY